MAPKRKSAGGSSTRRRRLKRRIAESDDDAEEAATAAFGDEPPPPPPQVTEKEIEALTRMKSCDALPTAIELAKRSRAAGFERDPRIISGDIRTWDHKGHTGAILVFEVMRRSSDNAKTWEDAKMEWVADETIGVLGWTCGDDNTTTEMLGDRIALGLGGCPLETIAPPAVVGASATSAAAASAAAAAVAVATAPTLLARPKQVIVDDGRAWEPGQCTCCQHRIRFRYHCVNLKTGERIVLGSTCVEQWGAAFSHRASMTRRVAIWHKPRDVVPGRKWIRR